MTSTINNRALRISITTPTNTRAADQRITVAKAVRDLRTGKITKRKTRLNVHAALRRTKPFVDEQVARRSPSSTPTCSSSNRA